LVTGDPGHAVVRFRKVIRRNAVVFIKKVRPPDKVEVAFGLKATGEVGNFAVAKAGAEANYTVTPISLKQ